MTTSGLELPTSQNGALYFPYLISNDPVTGSNIPVAPSGFVAGIYAQTDASRGVWKAPAGLATTVLNTSGPVLSGVLTDAQQGVLNLNSIKLPAQLLRRWHRGLGRAHAGCGEPAAMDVCAGAADDLVH